MIHDDGRAIRRSLQDPTEFAVIFDRHFATIHRYLARRTGADTADDLAAEVFTVAFARRASYDTDRALALPWLYGIAGNLLRADRRRRQRFDELHVLVAARSAVGPEELEDRVVTALDAHRQVRSLRHRLAGLSADDLTTLTLYAWEDLTYEEIAEALEIPVGTVRSRLHRVRRRLREPDPPGRASTGRHDPHPPKVQDR